MFLQKNCFLLRSNMCLLWLKMSHKIITSSKSNMLRSLWVDYCKRTLNVLIYVFCSYALWHKKFLCLLRFMHCSNTAQNQKDFLSKALFILKYSTYMKKAWYSLGRKIKRIYERSLTQIAIDHGSCNCVLICSSSLYSQMLIIGTSMHVFVCCHSWSK